MHGDGPFTARPWNGVPGSRGVAVRAGHLADTGDLRVTVAGTGEAQLRRLVRLLSAIEGIQVVGPAPAAGSQWRGAGDAFVVALHDPADDRPRAPSRTALHAVHPVPAPAAAPARPTFSARQVDVLTAYGQSSALIDVVARGLGMTGESMKTHLRRIRAKYSAVGRAAPTRRDLYVRAIEDGYLPPPC